MCVVLVMFAPTFWTAEDYRIPAHNNKHGTGLRARQGCQGHYLSTNILKYVAN